MVEVVKNFSVINRSTSQPGEFRHNYVRNINKRKLNADTNKINILDLKNDVGSLNHVHAFVMIPPKLMKRHFSKVSTSNYIDHSTVVELSSQSINTYSSLLEKSGCDRSAGRMMLASYLSGSQKGEEQCWPCVAAVSSSQTPTMRSKVIINDKQHLIPSIKLFDMQFNKNRLVWTDSNISMKNYSNAVGEAFRTVPDVLRRMIHNQTHLLDSYCAPVEASVGYSSVTPKSRNASNFISTSEHPNTYVHLSVEERQLQALECALARHSEAVLDSLLEMVLDFFLSHAELLDADQRRRECQRTSTPGETGDIKVDKSSMVSNLFEWEHVLCCLQTRGSQLERIGPSLQKSLAMDLPDVRLTPTMVDRTTNRLLSLFAETTTSGVSRAVPSVRKRRRTGETSITNGTGMDNKEVR